jgi:hypothetical protein
MSNVFLNDSLSNNLKKEIYTENSKKTCHNFSFLASTQNSFESFVYIFFNTICFISDIGYSVNEIYNFRSCPIKTKHSVVKSDFIAVNKTCSIAKRIFTAFSEAILIIDYSKKMIYSRAAFDDSAIVASSLNLISSLLGSARALRNIARINNLLNSSSHNIDKKKLQILCEYQHILLGVEISSGFSFASNLVSICFMSSIFKAANFAAFAFSGYLYFKQFQIYSIVSKKEFNVFNA